MSDEVIKVNTELIEPSGRLKDALDYVDTLPETIPKYVAELLTRLAFVEGYTQLISERTDYDLRVVEQNQEGLEEILTMCQVNTMKLKELIAATLSAGGGPDDRTGKAIRSV